MRERSPGVFAHTNRSQTCSLKGAKEVGGRWVFEMGGEHADLWWPAQPQIEKEEPGRVIS